MPPRTAARAQALLTEWDAITSYSELEVYAASGSAGVLSHDARRRENIRVELSNLLAFYVPRGGFAAEIRLRNGRGPWRFQNERTPGSGGGVIPR